ncbi:MAG: redoxin domain-containing protein [Actinobacteria bacterium]|nr:redoxin domain-containing protein [Actinomycetota bacterium]MTB16184.1 redoxin domain-containing protein [Actinomycetota bacterium]
MKRIALGLVLLTLVGCSSQSTAVPKVGEVISCASISRVAGGTGLQMPCLDGKSTIFVESLRGPLIVNVWGSWCASCKDELPIFRSFYAKSKSTVKMLGVDVEEAKDSDGKDFVVSQGMTWPNLLDPDSRSRGFFGMGVPVTWFIDAKGAVVHKKIGVIQSERELRDLTTKYLGVTVG